MVLVAKPFEVNPQTLRDLLSATERKQIDFDGNGDVSDDEATAAAKTADTDGDGFVSGDELNGFRKLLGGGFGLSDREALNNGLAARSKTLLAGAESKIAKDESEANKLRDSLGATGRVTSSGDVRKQLAALPTAKSLDQEIVTKKAEISSARRELDQLSHDRTAAAEFVRKNESAYQNGGAIVDNCRREVARLERVFSENPSEKTRSDLDAAKARLATTSSKAEKYEDSVKLLAQEPSRRADLERTIGDATKAIEQSEKTKAELPDLTKKLNKQLELAQLSESLERTRRDAGAYRALSGRATQATLTLEEQAKKRITAAKSALANASEAVAESRSNATKILLETAQASKTVLDGVKSGQFDGSHVDTYKAERNHRMATDALAKVNGNVERTGKKLVSTLEDPSFKDALAFMPEKERSELLSQMTQTLAGSVEGQKFFESRVAPVFEGKPNGNPIFENLKDAASGSEDASTALLDTVRALGGYRIASAAGKEDAAKALELCSKGVTTALGIRPDQLGVVEEAIALKNAGKELEAVRKLEAGSLGRLGKVLGAASNTMTSLAAIAAGFDLAQDPNAKNALAAGKGAAEVTEFMAKFATRSEAMAKYTKLVGAAHVAEGFAGKLVPVLDIAMGIHGLSGADGSIARGDVAGTFGHYLQAAGGATALTGGALALAPPLIPLGAFLAAAGGVMAGAGSLIDAVFGQSETEIQLNRFRATAIYVR